MKSPDTNELLIRGLQGKLNEREQEHLDALLAADAQLRARFDEERRLERLLDRLPDVPVSSNFTSLVLQAVESERARKSAPAKRPLFPWIHTAFARVAGGLIAVAALGLAGVHQYQKSQREDLANNVRSFTEVASVIGGEKSTPEDILRNFDTIKSLPLPASSDLDLELLVALQK